MYVWIGLSTGLASFELREEPKPLESKSEEMIKVLSPLNFTETPSTTKEIEKIAGEILVETVYFSVTP